MPKSRRLALNAALLLSVLVSTVLAGPRQTEGEGKGKIEFAELVFDFGFMPQNAVFSHNFVVRNTGRGVLNIVKVQPTCGCTTVPMDRAFLKPGEKTDIRVNFDSGKMQDNVNKRIKVLSTDPENGLVELYFKGIVGKSPETVELIGSALNFTDIGTILREVRVKNITPQPITLSVLPPADSFLEVAISSQKIAPQAEVILTIKLKKSPPLGEFKTSITLESSGQKIERISVPITGVGYAH